MKDEKPKVKSLYKALKLLDCFTADHPERWIKELAEQSGMLKSSVYNIMQTLQLCGFIEKGSANGKYRLGNKFLEFGNILATRNETRAIVKRFMERLAEECNEVVFFALPSGTDVIYFDSVHPKGVQFARSIVGIKAEMYCTSIGKAMLAFLGDELLEKAIASGLKAYTPNTITDPAALRREMEVTRKRGYAVDNMEHEYGIRCVGVPLRNRKGEIVGAISVSGPSLRVMEEQVNLFSQKLLEASREIQTLLN